MTDAPTVVAVILWAATMVDFISAARTAADRSRLVTAAIFACLLYTSDAADE